MFGAHNLLSVVQYIEKYGGAAAIVSYDLYKAYDRMVLDFLYRVMARMNFGSKFIDWIKMCHAGATTNFLLNFLTKPIDIWISVRQGDPMAMLLFEMFMEPLLMMIRKSIRGTYFFGESIQGSRPRDLNRREMCVNTLDEDYVDDVNITIQCEEDLIIVDKIFNKFEDMSGAILNRSSKTKILGLGEWEGKTDWVLPWIKVEPKLKIFGITFHPKYEDILEDNWRLVGEGFGKCLNAWKTRALDSIFQRVEVLRIFAMPKLWYIALLLPLPGKIATRFEQQVRNFIWKGRLEKPAYSELCNSVEEGGLGVPCIRSKADSLLLKQLLRMLEDNTACHHNHLKFWIGNFQRNWGELQNYPHAKVDQDMPWDKESALTEHYKKLLYEFEYGQKNGYYDKFTAGSLKKMTAKLLYELNTTTFTPPAIVYKRDMSDWALVWSRVGSLMVEPKGREMLYMIINNIYPTQERLWKINKEKKPEDRRVHTDVCQKCNQGVVQDCVHFFAECSNVQEGWYWLRARILGLLPDHQALSNFEILHLMFPKDNRVEDEVMFLIGNWTQLVYEEVVLRDRKLMDQFVRGHFQYKFYESMKKKMPGLNHIPDVTLIDPG